MPENAVEVRRASNSVLWKPGAGHNAKGRTEKATDNAIGQVRVGRRMWLEKTEIKSSVVEVGPQISGREDHQRKPQEPRNRNHFSESLKVEQRRKQETGECLDQWFEDFAALLPVLPYPISLLTHGGERLRV